MSTQIKPYLVNHSKSEHNNFIIKHSKIYRYPLFRISKSVCITKDIYKKHFSFLSSTFKDEYIPVIEFYSEVSKYIKFCDRSADFNTDILRCCVSSKEFTRSERFIFHLYYHVSNVFTIKKVDDINYTLVSRTDPCFRVYLILYTSPKQCSPRELEASPFIVTLYSKLSGEKYKLKLEETVNRLMQRLPTPTKQIPSKFLRNSIESNFVEFLLSLPKYKSKLTHKTFKYSVDDLEKYLSESLKSIIPRLILNEHYISIHNMIYLSSLGLSVCMMFSTSEKADYYKHILAIAYKAYSEDKPKVVKKVITPPNTYLLKNLKKLTLEELKEICRNEGIRGYSGYCKEKLIKMMESELFIKGKLRFS